MTKKILKKTVTRFIMSTTLLLVIVGQAPGQADIPGLTGTTFNFTAKADHIQTPDGGSYLMWGYADGANRMQFPGPTLILMQGDKITINLTNELPTINPAVGDPVPPPAVSIVFPGQSGVIASGGTPGLITREAQSGATVTYEFTAIEPGTYCYHSGTQPDLQIEMGLIGAIIVRPTDYDTLNRVAYEDPGSVYDHEYLFLVSEMDPKIHLLVEQGKLDEIDNNAYYPVYWMINGRCAIDTLLPINLPLLPSQPYNCLPRMHPGDRMLMRFIGGSRDSHPFHTHGNNYDLIARDGRLLSSGPGAGIDLAESDYTLAIAPGATYDTIFQWTGAGMGWDIYGHEHDIDNPPTGNFPGSEDIDHDGDGDMDVVPLAPGEDPADHGKPFPVVITENQYLTFGAFYSGSPFLGTFGDLPTGEGGNNLSGGFMYMWHTHNEKEMCNWDLFPGGMMTLLIIEPHHVIIQ